MLCEEKRIIERYIQREIIKESYIEKCEKHTFKQRKKEKETLKKERV